MMRILVATGGAEHSTFALWVASELCPSNAEVTLLSVAHSLHDRAHARHIVEQARSRWLPDHAHIATKVRTGRPAVEIVYEAEGGDYDLVVLGERMPHRLRTRLLGSVVAHVTEHAPCSVLIAKGVHRPVDRILLCDSGGGEPSIIELFGRSSWTSLWAQGSEITVLHVMSQITAAPGVPGQQLQADAGALIAEHSPEGDLLVRDLGLLAAYGIEATTRVRHGLVLEEILAESDAGDYGLVVIGAHRRSGWAGYLLTDLARQIVSHAQRSVLLLR